MLIHAIVAVSFASLLTAMLAFRFRIWDRRRLLVGYFSFFSLFDFAVQTWFIPPDALGLEIAAVFFVLTGLFIVASRTMRQIFSDESEDEGRQKRR